MLTKYLPARLDQVRADLIRIRVSWRLELVLNRVGNLLDVFHRQRLFRRSIAQRAGDATIQQIRAQSIPMEMNAIARLLRSPICQRGIMSELPIV